MKVMRRWTCYYCHIKRHRVATATNPAIKKMEGRSDYTGKIWSKKADRAGV